MSACLIPATVTPSLAPSINLPANWRLEGGQNLPDMPGLLMVLGAPQAFLCASSNDSFLPSVLCLPTETPCSGTVTSKACKTHAPALFLTYIDLLTELILKNEKLPKRLTERIRKSIKEGKERFLSTNKIVPLKSPPLHNGPKPN